MYRACELKDQTYKKTRTLHFSDLTWIQKAGRGEWGLGVGGHPDRSGSVAP